MHIDIIEMVRVSDNNSFINVFSGLLDYYMKTAVRSYGFDAYDLTFTCQDLVGILRANKCEFKPPQEHWKNFLTKSQKASLFDMVCHGTLINEIEQEVFRYIEYNGLTYHVKEELYRRIKALDVSTKEIAENVYEYFSN